MKKHIKKISNLFFPKRKNLLFFCKTNPEVENILNTLTEKELDKFLGNITNNYKFKKDLKTSSKIVRNLIKSPSFSEKHIDMLLDNNLAFFSIVINSPKFTSNQSNEYIEQCPNDIDSINYLLIFMERKRKDRALIGKKQIDLFLEKAVEALKIEKSAKNDLHFWKFINNISHCPSFTQAHHDYIIDNLRYGYTRIPNIIETFKKHSKVFKMTHSRKNTLLNLATEPQKLEVKKLLDGVNTHTCNFTDSRILENLTPKKSPTISSCSRRDEFPNPIQKKKQDTDTSKIKIFIRKKPPKSLQPINSPI
jgi:hypothetical protein